jgi:flagellar biosynthesis protein FlhF
MRSALELVREEQGPDVLILSNRKVKDGIELVTADGDIDEALVQKFAEQAKAKTSQRAREVKPQRDAERPRSANNKRGATPAETLHDDDGAQLWTDKSMVAAMRRELGGLRGLLEQQLSGFAWSDYGSKYPLHARLLRDLSRAGIAPSLGRELIAGLPEHCDFANAWTLVLSALEARVRVLDDPILKHGGRVMLCGPTGVGKTLLACKLAANFALANGADSVALVSTDELRLGAQHQLKVFGGLLGIAVHAARGHDDLSACLERVKDKALVLIDTAGAPVDDIRIRELVTQLDAPEDRAHCYLVLSASTEYQSLGRVLRAAADLAFHGCILTKLDEAAVLGPALSALVEAKLPVAYLSAGQQVPDDLETPLARQLVLRAIASGEESPADEDPAVIERAFMN